MKWLTSIVLMVLEDFDWLLSSLHIDPAVFKALGIGKEIDELICSFHCIEVALAQTEMFKRVPTVRAIEGRHDLFSLLSSEEVAVSQPENLQSFLTCQSGCQSIDSDLASLLKESKLEAYGLKI